MILVRKRILWTAGIVSCIALLKITETGYTGSKENDGEMVIGKEFVRVFLILSASVQDMRESMRKISSGMKMNITLSNGQIIR